MNRSFPKRLLALLLAAILTVGVCLPAAAAPSFPQDAPDMVSIEQYRSFVQAQSEKSAGPGFYRFLRTARFIIRLMTGQLLLPDRNFDVRMDPLLDNYCAYIAANSDLDITRILTNLPDTSLPAELAVKVFRIDTEQMRRKMYEKRDKLWGEGKEAEAMIYYFLGAYYSVMKSCDVTAVTTDEENVIEVVLYLTYRDGEREDVHPGIFINTVTNEAYNRDGKGIVETGFNCSIYELLVYAPVNAWMRDYGFCFGYDLACYLSPNWMWNYTTRRFKFKYDDREWMIQIWKGSYLVTNGGEIGVYNRDKKKIGTHYDCVGDEDMLEMSMSVSHGDEELFSLPAARHWWINGFKMDKVRYAPSSLTMRASIVLRDEEMLGAFLKAVDRNYRHDVHYTVDGLTAYLTW
ncbi:MAG: DUF4474 domain-containing protein [Clostridia bacterium]|nr:DUF4474 domain-containing protein [Clostridia bacterium]